jgi:hypothetical protein
VVTTLLVFIMVHILVKLVNFFSSKLLEKKKKITKNTLCYVLNKLRRAVKSKRKRIFSECKYKQCLISSRTRKTCTECRFKKCIAVGMDLSRSKYGRHTSETQLNDRDHVPNISSALIELHENLSNSFILYLKDNPRSRFRELSELFENFYKNSLDLLGTDKTRLNTFSWENGNFIQNDEQHSFFYSRRNIDLSEPIVLATFMVLFDYNFNDLMLPNSIAIVFARDLSMIKVHIYEQLLGNEFSLILKILSFIYVLHLFKNDENSLQDAYKKRLTDLIKSEFSLFKVKDNEQSGNNDYVNNNRTCIFDCFMLSIFEIGILANQYFDMRISH